MTNRITELLGSLPGRIGAGGAAMVAIASSLPVAEAAVFSLEKTLVVAVAVGAWLWAEIGSHSLSPHPQDVKLYDEARALLADGMRFIGEHDFGNSFKEQSSSCFVRYLDEWKGQRYRFVDKKLQKAWDPVDTSIKEFARYLVENCGPMHKSLTTITVQTTQDLQSGVRSLKTLAAADELNRLATDVSKGWEKFVSIAARRLRVAV